MRVSGLVAGLAGVALLSLANAAPALAQDVDRIDRITGSTTPGGSFRPPEGVKVVSPGALVFASFDGNFDGSITREEITAGAQHAFKAADRNSDGAITGFEQTDWAASMGDAAGVLANAMTFDIDLDRSVTLAEFTSGLLRMADQIADETGAVRFSDLIQPLNRASMDPPGSADNGFGWGTVRGRGTPPRDRGG
jgi:hypothetical protein